MLPLAHIGLHLRPGGKSVFVFYKLRQAEVSFSIKPGAPGASGLAET